MFEKVNPSHPDKVADRVAGALVDLAYKREKDPRVAVEALLGHEHAYIITESSVSFTHDDVMGILGRICGKGVIDPMGVRLLSIPQDVHLSNNQKDGLRCGDNGIFRGALVSGEEQQLTDLVGKIYEMYPTDGKYILCNDDVTACQSQSDSMLLNKMIHDMMPTAVNVTVNPLGEWTGGLDVDSGATNRKLGSDMGRGVTGGGLHGKDLSKADVSVNIVCHLLAQKYQTHISASCAIGDDAVEFVNEGTGEKNVRDYTEVVDYARRYIKALGGFEKFAEWGLIRPRI